MTIENYSAYSSVIPIINPQPEPLRPALASWCETMDAFQQAWTALNDVDDYHTAFLALHVVQNAIQVYQSNLTTRAPKDGDLANLRRLREHTDLCYSAHDRFIDEPHIDYPALKRIVLTELQNLREDATRRGALHAIGMACVEFAPLSYGSSIDDMLLIEEAVNLIESYKALNPMFVQQFEIKPLASTLQKIAVAEAAGFSDYNDETFTVMFENLTVRIARLHLDKTTTTPAS